VGRSVQCRGLAGQPLEIAVLAVVDDRMGRELMAQPEIGGDVTMRRYEVGVVVAGGLVEMVAARGLDQDGDVAEGDGGEVEGWASGPAAHEGIGRGVSPSGRDFGADLVRQFGEEVAVAGEGELDA